MKKTSILILSVLILSSCESKGLSSFVSSDGSDSSISDGINDAALHSLMNNTRANHVEEIFLIYKGSNVIYEKSIKYTYDAFNGFEYVYEQIRGISSLDEVSSTLSENNTIYYDGEYSYTLDSDAIYKKDVCKKELNGFAINYDLSLLEEIEIDDDGYSSTLKGKVKKEKAKTFLNSTVDDLSEITFVSESMKGNVFSYELSYQSGYYDITHTFMLNYNDYTLSLPTSSQIK